MKKKIIIPIIIGLVLLIGTIYYTNNRVVATITIDINPSIEIKLNKNEKTLFYKTLDCYQIDTN